VHHEAGVPIEDVAVMMGHKGTRVTTRYIHANEQTIERDRDAFSEATRKAKERKRKRSA
jgi:hypothetical protein